MNLKGIAIGNGFIDPKSQYGSEIDYLIERGLWKAKSNQHTKAVEDFKRCEKAIAQTVGNPRAIGPCERVLQDVIAIDAER